MCSHSSTAALDMTADLQEVVLIRQELEAIVRDEKQDKTAILDILTALEKCNLTANLLMKSGISSTIKRIRKKVKDKEVLLLVRKIMKSWENGEQKTPDSRSATIGKATSSHVTSIKKQKKSSSHSATGGVKVKTASSNNAKKLNSSVASVKLDSSKATSIKADPSSVTSIKADSSSVTSIKADSSRAISIKADPSSVTSIKADPSRATGIKAGSASITSVNGSSSSVTGIKRKHSSSRSTVSHKAKGKNDDLASNTRIKAKKGDSNSAKKLKVKKSDSRSASYQMKTTNLNSPIRIRVKDTTSSSGSMDHTPLDTPPNPMSMKAPSKAVTPPLMETLTKENHLSLISCSSTDNSTGTCSSNPWRDDVAFVLNFPPNIGEVECVPSTGSSVRDKCREVVVKALKNGISKVSVQDEYKFYNLACYIEANIYECFEDTNSKYKQRVRSRASNLGDLKNPGLRQQVISGQISPARLAVMSPEEMASDSMKKLRDELTKEAIRDAQVAQTGESGSDLLTCPECHKNKCSYTQAQILCSDEPMTTFAYCNNCGHRWTFDQ